MAENQTQAADSQADAAVEELPVNIRVEDAGPATKKVFVEVPRERVSAKITEQYKQLRQGAMIAGFRKGHAPQKLIERRFADDIKEQVRRSLISESYEEAIKKHSIQVLGEPEFENPDQIKLDADAPLTYSFSVEIQPEITLPSVEGIKVKKPKIAISEEHINQALLNLREQQGTMTPVEDRGVEARDFVTADVHVKVDGEVIGHQHDAQLVARPGRVAGLQIADFDKQLAGAKPGDTRDVTVKGPDNHPNEKLRGKDVHIEVAVKDIKRLEPVELNQDFLDSLGFRDEAELRQALREQMQERIDWDIATIVRNQVMQYLLENTNVTLPAKLSDKQTERVVSRRAVALMNRGVPQERIESSIEQLKTGAAEEGARELKSFFILQKVSQEYQIQVNEGELNSRVATLAMQRGQRPDRLRQELDKSGMLSQLLLQLREEKALDKLLEKAQIEEVEPTAEQQQAATGTGEAEADASSAT